MSSYEETQAEYRKAVDELNRVCQKQTFYVWSGLLLFLIAQISIIVYLDYKGVV